MSSKLSVGTHILTVLALQDGRPLTSEQIACSVNTNPVVIRRLLGLLRAAGYVEAKKGSGGGWVLRADPAEITLHHVLCAVEPQCETFSLHRSAPNQGCPVGRHIQGMLTEVYGEIREGMAKQLSQSTIAGLVSRLKQRCAL